MKRISIIGCSGSGKSTLARNISKKLNIPVHHIDRIYWRPNWIAIPKEQLISEITKIMENDSWIIDGNYESTLNLRTDKSDIIILLDISKWSCLWNIIKRKIFCILGRTRTDITNGCPEKIEWGFIKWIYNYPEQEGVRIIEKLRDVRDKKIIILHNEQEIKSFLKTL